MSFLVILLHLISTSGLSNCTKSKMLNMSKAVNDRQDTRHEILTSRTKTVLVFSNSTIIVLVVEFLLPKIQLKKR